MRRKTLKLPLATITVALFVGLGVGANLLLFQRGQAAVTLVRFEAFPEDGKVRLEWETGTEIDNAGFYVRRSLEPEALGVDYQRLPDSWTPAQGDSLVGATYSWVDTDVQNGVTYYYMLEAVDINNQSELYGPVSAVPGQAATATPTPQPANTPTATATPTPQAANTPTATPTPTQTPAPTPTPSPTASPAPTATTTATPAPTSAPTATATQTPPPTSTPAVTPTSTSQPLRTPAPSATSRPASPTPTNSLKPTATATRPAAGGASPLSTPTATPPAYPPASLSTPTAVPATATPAAYPAVGPTLEAYPSPAPSLSGAEPTPLTAEEAQQGPEVPGRIVAPPPTFDWLLVLGRFLLVLAGVLALWTAGLIVWLIRSW